MRLMTNEKLLTLYEAVKELELDKVFKTKLEEELKRRDLQSEEAKNDAQ